VTTILNGFPSSWDTFVQGICARRKFPKFDKLWTDCTQEESRLISKSNKTNNEENQDLVAHVKKGEKKKKHVYGEKHNICSRSQEGCI
jgi:hypothetical protein